jgi:hypothetical protein
MRYIVFDYLAELTMSILAAARAKNRDLGYATDFVDVVAREILASCRERGIRLIANAGGVNPGACAKALERLAAELGVSVKVAVVDGDEVLALLPRLRERGVTDFYSGTPMPERLLSANAYFGALPIARALAGGADVVVTGRVVDSAVTLGALIHEFGWRADDYDRLAAGSLAGAPDRVRLPGDRRALHRLEGRARLGEHGLPGPGMRRRRLVRRHESRAHRRHRFASRARRAAAVRDRRSGELRAAGRRLRLHAGAHGERGQGSRASDRRARQAADCHVQGERDVCRRLSRDRHADDHRVRGRGESAALRRSDPRADARDFPQARSCGLQRGRPVGARNRGRSTARTPARRTCRRR